MQWQDDHRNTGGLHFYPTDPNSDYLPEGYQAWQNEMYEAMYGFKRPANCSEYRLDTTWGGVEGFVDLKSVSNALALEFTQALDAVVHQGEIALDDKERINFKFCRAGMGFFSSGLHGSNVRLLRVARLEGIEIALRQIAAMPEDERGVRLGKIGRLILPHSNEASYSDEVLSRIGTLVNSLGLEWGGAPEEDPFKPESGYVNATTNCADPHAMPGNEGGPCSVDACIAYNANINNHNATYNEFMQLRTAPEFVFRVGMDSSAASALERDSGPKASSKVERPLESVRASASAGFSAPAKKESTFDTFLKFFSRKPPSAPGVTPEASEDKEGKPSGRRP